MGLLDNDSRDLSLEALFEMMLDGRDEDTHKVLIGKVERYVSGDQVADIRPLIRRIVPTTDGGTRTENHPIIRAVPVGWTRAGGYFIHLPLKPGDFCLMLCADRDIARWRQTGEEADPLDRRLHHISHAIALPCVYPRTRNLSAGDTPGDEAVFGREGGSAVRIRDDDQIHVAGAATLALAVELGSHLSAIAAAFDAVAARIAVLDFGPIIDASYGVIAKGVLDGTDPIPTTKTKGS
jgi:hypothetical protein